MVSRLQLRFCQLLKLLSLVVSGSGYLKTLGIFISQYCFPSDSLTIDNVFFFFNISLQFMGVPKQEALGMPNSLALCGYEVSSMSL